MFNDDGGFFGDAGGYGGGGGGGPSTTPKTAGKGDQNKRAQNVLPVTTRQIRNSTESGIQIGGIDFYLVTLVGRVLSINTTSLKATYVLEDDRGTIEAVHWMDQDSEYTKSTVVENVFCRVYASIRSQEDKKFLMVFSIKPIKSLNELTSHRMEVAVIAKKVELSANKTFNGMETSNDVPMNGGGGGGLGNSLMDMGYNKVPMSNMQRQVFAVIRRFEDPGVHVNDINNYLTEKISQAQIAKICEDLMNEGHIYSSVDEHHFLCTETS